ncbi:hypothetical protein [Micromonospora sp. NPDC049240]|uniref:hypothetical protein n=1 Tax=Micromonospora sp. NPDC049240 TaxID=3155151 RepID=UPI0034087629
MSTTCEACGATKKDEGVPGTVRYTLGPALATALMKLKAHGGPAKRVDLALTGPEYSVFHKLAYWGLAESKEGWWSVTAAGINWVNEIVRVPQVVYSIDGVIVPGGELVSLGDVLAGKRVAA